MFTFALLVVLCTQEFAYGAIHPVAEPPYLVKTSAENQIVPNPGIPDFKAKDSRKGTMDNDVKQAAGLRHLRNVKGNAKPIAVYEDSASAAAPASKSKASNEENSFEEQRKFFLDLLDTNAKGPKKYKRHHRSNKIKLRYDYINLKYSITEDSEDE